MQVCPRSDARLFATLKQFKMADLCPFMCQNYTFLPINLKSLDLRFPSFHRCCFEIISCFLFKGSPVVIKGDIFPEFPRIRQNV